MERMEQEGNTPTPEEVTKAKDGILKAADSWEDVDTEAFKAYIKDRRQTANRPINVNVASPLPSACYRKSVNPLISLTYQSDPKSNAHLLL